MNSLNLPKPTERNIAIHISSQAERAVRVGHPWLFENAIQKQSKEGQAGDLAVIFDKKRRFLAIGLYDPTSPIRVKILQAKQSATINQDFFRARLTEAAEIRQPLMQSGTTGYRLVHGENDRLPGLIIDRYADTLVIKLYTAAWFPHLQHVLAALADVHSAERWVLRLGRSVQESETFGLEDGQILKGDPITEPIEFIENGLTLGADVVRGHKTGFFFDQRDNRFRVRELAQGKRVLDVFSYNGGFAVSAAAGGAESVLSIDISAPALESAQRNIARNQHLPEVANCEFDTWVADAFEALATLTKKFDLVVVDPPSFANSANQIDGALKAYSKLAELALPRVEQGGILLMGSCSSRVKADAFFATLQRATNNRLIELERTFHAVDHPMRPEFPEGAYLKALYSQVK